LPLAQFLTPQRQREYEDAMTAWRQLGPILPDEPILADPIPAAGGARPGITTPARQFTREAQEGL
jgi:hypothetical protein